MESHLQANNLVNTLNYLVTTKGLPLKINRGDTFSMSSPSASVESELMLILGSNAYLIGGTGRTYSPYYSKKRIVLAGSVQHVSRHTTGWLHDCRMCWT